MNLSEPLVGGMSSQKEMCNAHIGVYPKLKFPTTHSTSLNAVTWGERYLGWHARKESELERILVTPVTIGNRTYDHVPTIEPLLDARFWENEKGMIKRFEADGLTEPYLFS